MDLKRRKFERAIASEIAHELHRAFGPIRPEALAEKNEVVCKVFGEAFDRHGVTESAAERILHLVPALLADLNRQHAELHRQLNAATRQGISDRERRHHHQPDYALNQKLYVTGRIQR